jgi:transposase
MKDVGNFSILLLSVKPVDFRNQAYGLARFVKEVFGEQPLNAKSLFIFTNKKRTSIRFLYWDHTGFALWSKALEKEKFKWPRKVEGEKFQISQRQLKWLLQGVDIEKIKMHEPLNFTSIQ